MGINRFNRRVPSTGAQKSSARSESGRAVSRLHPGINISNKSSWSEGAVYKNFRFNLNLIRKSESRVAANRNRLANGKSFRVARPERILDRNHKSLSRIPESLYREQVLARVRQRITDGFYDSPQFIEKLADLLIEKFGLSGEKG